MYISLACDLSNQSSQVGGHEFALQKIFSELLVPKKAQIMINSLKIALSSPESSQKAPGPDWNPPEP